MPRHVRVRGGMRVVGHHHNRLAEVLVQTFENLQNLSGRMAVEVAGRFVCQQQRRIADDGASNGDALFLSARKLLGKMVGAVFQVDELQRGHHVITALLRVELGQQQRKFHVLKGGEYRDQVERLENVADVRIAPVGRLFVIEPENVLPQNQQLACSRAIDGRDHVQQRGLPRAGRPHEREKFATGNLDGDVVEGFHLEGIAFEHLADISGLDDPGLSSDISCNSSAHDCPLILILFPSFISLGTEWITSSPPFKSCTWRDTLCIEIYSTCRIRAFPLKAMKTTFFPSRSRNAVVGTNTPDGWEPPFFPSSAKNFTVEFISGRRYSSGLRI